MKFNTNGYLDAGLHPATLADIKTHLVDTFPFTTTRLPIFKGYERNSSELSRFGIHFNQFFDGSFVSSKVNPGDIDLLTMADNASVNALTSLERTELSMMFLGKASKPTYQCDSFFLASFPETDPAYQHYRAQRKYWMGEFGYDRVDKPKGILTVNVDPAPPASTSLSALASTTPATP